MSYLHDRGVKGFVAMNVLVFDDELPLVEERVRQMAKAGVDAVIVQVSHQGVTALSSDENTAAVSLGLFLGLFHVEAREVRGKLDGSNGTSKPEM